MAALKGTKEVNKYVRLTTMYGRCVWVCNIVLVKKTNISMLYRKITAVYCKNYRRYKTIFWRKTQEFKKKKMFFILGLNWSIMPRHCDCWCVCCTILWWRMNTGHLWNNNEQRWNEFLREELTPLPVCLSQTALRLYSTVRSQRFTARILKRVLLLVTTLIYNMFSKFYL